MKQYIIRNVGCDDETEFEIELTDEQLEFVIKLFDKNNIVANEYCKPELYIYNYDGYSNEWYNRSKKINRSNEELNGEQL